MMVIGETLWITLGRVTLGKISQKKKKYKTSPYISFVYRHVHTDLFMKFLP